MGTSYEAMKLAEVFDFIKNEVLANLSCSNIGCLISTYFSFQLMSYNDEVAGLDAAQKKKRKQEAKKKIEK